MTDQENNSFRLPGGPAANVRLPVYAALWAGIIGTLVVVIPSFTPIFEKLKKVDELPALTAGLLTVVHFNAESYYFPLFGIVLVFLATDFAVVTALRRRPGGGFSISCWFVACCLLLIGIVFVIVNALLSPVFKMSTAVG